MVLEPVLCPYCAYRYRTDLEKIEKDGNTKIVRGSGPSGMKETIELEIAKNFYNDLKCPNCKKEFEWEVKT